MNKYRRTWIVLVGLLAQCMAAVGKEVLSHITESAQWTEIWTPFIFFSVLATLGVSIVGWLFPSPVDQMREWQEEVKNGFSNKGENNAKSNSTAGPGASVPDAGV